MAKSTERWICSSCEEYESPKEFGRCPKCKQFNTAVVKQQAAGTVKPIGRGQLSVQPAQFRSFAEVEEDAYDRFSSGDAELDRVLGGGVVIGSIIVLGGEPGQGKSTLLTQIAIALARSGKNVGYGSAEESERQVKMRVNRLGGEDAAPKIKISTETSAERLCESIMSGEFDVVIVDSIQTILSEEQTGIPGSRGQVQYCTQLLRMAAKQSGTAVFVVGQVTKEGELAGPQSMAHEVDALLMFEGDRREQFRILRGIKNRFGSTDEIGVFEMTGTGLIAVPDPSAIFCPELEEGLPGACSSAILEGSRPLLCQVEALVNKSMLPQPIRSSRGIDPKRSQMLLAVLSRKCNYRLGSYDVYVNVAGGLKVDEPALDLAICIAVASAYTRRPVKERLCAFGEVSLLGRVRTAAQAERRGKEAERNGFKAFAKDGHLASVIEDALSSEVVESDEGLEEAAEV